MESGKSSEKPSSKKLIKLKWSCLFLKDHFSRRGNSVFLCPFQMAGTSLKNIIPVTEILAAQQRLKGVAQRTPLVKNHHLSQEYKCNLFLKREDLQVVRSFKIRGAFNKISSLSSSELKKGVICASAGNHAQGVAFACAELHVHGDIYMPTTTPKQKISKVRLFGKNYINIILVGDTYDDAQREALEKAKETGATFVHPFDDEVVIAGQGTVASEIIEDADVTVDYLIVAVGGGGLISGVGSYFKVVSPDTKIIAVEAAGAAALDASCQAGKRVALKTIDSFADGIAVKQIGEVTFPICQSVIDDHYTVPEGKICSTILSLYNDEGIVVEPAGAIGVAALDYLKEEIKGKNVVVIICGGNNDITRTEEIRERSLLWEGKKHYFIIKFPQRAGALKEFLDVLGPDDDITHFEYTKKKNRETGPALVGIELKRKEDYQGLIERMEKSSINFLPINDDPMLFEMLV